MNRTTLIGPLTLKRGGISAPRARDVLALAATCWLLQACESTTNPVDPSADGQVHLALSAVPNEARCLRVVASGYRSVVRTFSLIPSQPFSALLGGLPSGEVALAAEVFTRGCESLSGSTPGWISEPTIVIIAPPAVANVTLLLRRNGQANIGIVFEDEENGPDASVPDAALDSGSGPCPSNGSIRSSSAAAFVSSSGNACQLPTPSDGAYVALPPLEFASSAACGRCVSITGPGGTRVAPVMERCDSCPTGLMDLTQPLFDAVFGVGAPGLGSVTWQFVPCPCRRTVVSLHPSEQPLVPESAGAQPPSGHRNRGSLRCRQLPGARAHGVQ